MPGAPRHQVPSMHAQVLPLAGSLMSASTLPLTFTHNVVNACNLPAVQAAEVQCGAAASHPVAL